MKELAILGTGCAKCTKLEANRLMISRSCSHSEQKEVNSWLTSDQHFALVW